MFLTIPAMLLVDMGLGQPSAYPYVMGSVSQMNSLRGVWGRTWHQFGRTVITSIARRLRDKVFCVPAGSLASSCLQLCTGFALGAGTHFIAGWMAGSRTGWQDESGAMTFFAMQLLGIMLEDGFKMLGFRVLNHDWRRRRLTCGEDGDGTHKGHGRLASLPQLVGYVWVFAWLSMSIPPYVDGLRKVGALSEPTVPFSVIDWVVAY